MRDRFDYTSYWRILDRLQRTHRLVPFADLVKGEPSLPFAILRHDIDYSIDAALAMAEQEAARGVRATYFLLLNGSYYNLLEPTYVRAPARLVELGHDVGLHYDVRSLYQFPMERWIPLIDLQAEVVGALSGVPVTSIAMHQPGLNGRDPLRGRTQYLNAYDDRFFLEMTYLSDSARAWRDETWRVLDVGPLPARLQFLIHPINWGPVTRTRQAIFADVHETLAREVLTAGQVLEAQIARHAGVLEHEAALLPRAQRPDA